MLSRVALAVLGCLLTGALAAPADGGIMLPTLPATAAASMTPVVPVPSDTLTLPAAEVRQSAPAPVSDAAEVVLPAVQATTDKLPNLSTALSMGLS